MKLYFLEQFSPTFLNTVGLPLLKINLNYVASEVALLGPTPFIYLLGNTVLYKGQFHKWAVKISNTIKIL